MGDVVEPDFRLLFEAAPTALLVVDTRFVIVAVSDALIQATGISRAAVVGRLVFDVFPDDPDEQGATGVDNLRASLERVSRDRVPDVSAVQRHAIARSPQDGGGFDIRYWAPVTVPVSDAGGQLRYLTRRVDDVTAYVSARLGQPSQQDLNEHLTGRAESEVPVQQQLLRLQRDDNLLAVLDSLDTVVLGCDADARPMLVNEAARELFGALLGAQVPLSQWPGHLGLSDAHGRSLDADDQPLLRVVRGEHLQNAEVVAQLPDAAARVFQMHGRPVAGGGRLAAVVALHEVTLQRRAERLKDCELQIAAVLAKPGPADLLLTDAVQLLGGMLGWAAAEFYTVDNVGHVLRRVSCWSADDADLVDKFPDQLAEGVGVPGRAWRSAEPVWVDDLHTDPVAAGQAEDWGRLHGALAVPIPSGAITVGVLVCYSRHRETPDDMRTAVLSGVAAHFGEFLERRRAEQYAEELERSQHEYVSLVGHELRTPLTSIQAYTDMIIAEPDMPAGDRTEMLAVLQRNTGRLHSLVGRLMDVSGIRSGHLPTRMQEMDLAALVRAAADDACATVEGRVRIDVNAPVEAIIDGDPHRLRQVIDELLANALAWAPGDSTVGVNLHADAHTCVLAISNTGATIGGADRARLFDLLFRTDTALTNAVPGTGLGLTLARAIVEQHSGSITVSEPEEAATTFTVRLPTRHVAAPEADDQ